MVQKHCKHDQIVNPKTNRCVNISGGVVASLLQEYNQGMVQLSPEDLSKLMSHTHTSGKIKLNNHDAKKLTKQLEDAPKSPAKKDVGKAKSILCAANEIYDPEFHECISLQDSHVGYLVDKHISGEIQLLPHDVLKVHALPKYKKMIAANYTKLVPPSKKKEVLKKQLPPPKISAKLADKLKLVAKQTRERVANHYANPEHKAYCNASPTKRLSMLRPPVLSQTISVSLPLYKLQHQTMILHMQDPTLHTKQPYMLPTNDTFKVSISMDSHNKSWKLQESVIGRKGNYVEEIMDTMVDYEWFRLQNEYIRNLPFRSLYTVLGYTNVGDVLVNNYHRGTLTPDRFYAYFNPIGAQHNFFMTGARVYPLFYQFIDEIRDCTYRPISSGQEKTTILAKIGNGTSQDTVEEIVNNIKTGIRKKRKLTDYEMYMYMLHIGKHLSMYFWKRVIQRFSSELQEILRKAPKPQKMMYVYRGVKDDYYLQGTKNANKVYLKGKTFYRNDGFVSTSLDVDKAYYFVDPTAALPTTDTTRKRCCFQRITILPGSTCLLLTGTSYYQEMEILLGLDTIYYMRETKKVKYYLPLNNNNYCIKDAPRVPTFTSDIVIVK